MKDKRSFIYLFFSIFLLLSFICCKQSYQNQINNESNNLYSNLFIDANKRIIQNEEAIIDSLLSLSQIPFTKDTTGIRICINQINDNKTPIYPKEGDNVVVLYNCIVFDDVNTILDDVLIDTISFKIGHSKQMRGLNYAIKLLKVGDKAKIVIPWYLGFGMSGYGKSVPPYSTLLLNVQLLNIKK